MKKEKIIELIDQLSPSEHEWLYWCIVDAYALNPDPTLAEKRNQAILEAKERRERNFGLCDYDRREL